MIEIRHVTKRYGAREALAGVSFSVAPGESTLLLRANGAGSSTLLRCLLAIRSFDGQIRGAELDPLTDGAQLRAHNGYMPPIAGLHQEVTGQATMAVLAAIRAAAAGRAA